MRKLYSGYFTEYCFQVIVQFRNWIMHIAFDCRVEHVIFRICYSFRAQNYLLTIALLLTSDQHVLLVVFLRKLLTNQKIPYEER